MRGFSVTFVTIVAIHSALLGAQPVASPTDSLGFDSPCRNSLGLLRCTKYAQPRAVGGKLEDMKAAIASLYLGLSKTKLKLQEDMIFHTEHSVATTIKQ